MNLKGVIISSQVMEDVRTELNIELFDYAYYIGCFSASYTKLRARSEGYLDTPQSLIIRYINRTYPLHRRLATSASGLVPPKGRSTYIPKLSETEARLVSSEKAIKALCHFNENHPDGLHFRGNKLDLTKKKGHLGIVIGRTHASARKFYDGETSLTNSIFRWVDIVSTHLEYKDDLLMLESILEEEADAWKANTDEMLKSGWAPRLVAGGL